MPGSFAPPCACRDSLAEITKCGQPDHFLFVMGFRQTRSNPVLSGLPIRTEICYRWFRNNEMHPTGRGVQTYHLDSNWSNFVGITALLQ